MTMGRMMLAAALLVLPVAAHADMTASYGVANGTTPFMTLEIAGNGDIHGAMMNGNITFIVQGDHGFTILKTPEGPVVERVEDVATVMGEQLAKMDPALRDKIGQHAGEISLAQNGTQTVNGRTGDAYFMKLPNGTMSGEPWAVISHDPKLAPLGKAMADQFAMSMKLMGPVIPLLAFQQMLDVLHKGTPIMMTGMQLLSVSDAPVAPSEFVLPGPPQTLDQVRQRIAAQANRGTKAGG